MGGSSKAGELLLIRMSSPLSRCLKKTRHENKMRREKKQKSNKKRKDELGKVSLSGVIGIDEQAYIECLVRRA